MLRRSRKPRSRVVVMAPYFTGEEDRPHGVIPASGFLAAVLGGWQLRERRGENIRFGLHNRILTGFRVWLRKWYKIWYQRTLSRLMIFNIRITMWVRDFLHRLYSPGGAFYKLILNRKKRDRELTHDGRIRNLRRRVGSGFFDIFDDEDPLDRWENKYHFLQWF